MKKDNNLDATVSYFLYYSTIYELQSNNLKINNLKGFSYRSVDESLLWQAEFKNISSKIPNAFYCGLEEVRFIYKEVMEQKFNDKEETNFSAITIRCAILGAILLHSNARVVYDEIRKIDRVLYEFLLLCNSLYDGFSKEFQIDDYSLLISSLHGFADIYTKSEFLNNATKEGERLFGLMESLMKDKTLEKFFSPYEYISNSLIGIFAAKQGKSFMDIAVFKDSFLWVSPYGESSFLSFVFLEKETRKEIIILEGLRLITKAERYPLQDTRKEIFRESLISFIFLNKDGENAKLEKTVLHNQNIENLRKKFWLENNKRKIDGLLPVLSKTVSVAFENFMSNINSMRQEDAYYLLFSNIHNSVENLLLETNTIYCAPFQKDEIDDMANGLFEKLIEIILKKGS